MGAPSEPSLQELAAKFADSDEETLDTNETDPVVAKPGHANEQVASGDAGDPSQAKASLTGDGLEQFGDSEDDEDEEEDWDSEDEELASAMEWADLRDGEEVAAAWQSKTELITTVISA